MKDKSLTKEEFLNVLDSLSVAVASTREVNEVINDCFCLIVDMTTLVRWCKIAGCSDELQLLRSFVDRNDCSRRQKALQRLREIITLDLKIACAAEALILEESRSVWAEKFKRSFEKFEKLVTFEDGKYPQDTTKTETKTKEKPEMTKPVEVTTKVMGYNLKTLTNDQAVDGLERAQANIASLEKSAANKTKYVLGQIAELNKAVTMLTAHLNK